MLIIFLILILMILIWSFSFIIVHIAVGYIPPLSFALYRCIISSMSFLIIDLYVKLIKNRKLDYKKEEIKNNEFTKNDWVLIIIASFTGISFFYFIQYNAIMLVGPSIPALFVCLLAPVIISVLALFFYDEYLNKFKIFGFIIATIGGFFLVTGGNIENLSPNSTNFLGYMLALLTPLLWAIYATVTKKIVKEKSSLKMLKYIVYFGTLELLVLVIITGEFNIFLRCFNNIIILFCAIYLGLASYILGSYIWQYSQKRLKSSKVASFLYVQPFLTLFFSYLFQRNEVIVMWNIIGGIIVLFAVLIINYK